MLSVAEARGRILAAMAPLCSETVALPEALGRVLAANIAARRDQPPMAVSAMDGYALRAADVAAAPVTLAVVGEVPAGGSHDAALGPGEAVRIFTGAPLPEGADAIVIQEKTTPDGDRVRIAEPVPVGHYLRPRGLDFKAGQIGLERGRRITARDIGLAAAMNHPWLPVVRRPRVAILATGDEVVMPGEPLGPTQIVSSNGLALAAFVTACGGTALNLGIAPDEQDALGRFIAAAEGADLLLTSGGASVGKHDLVRQVMADRGMALDFWKIAMRPGKPLIFGKIGATPLIGLPGNPVSGVVCATLFLRPALEVLLGRDPEGVPASEQALLTRPLGANDERQDYLRATLERAGPGAGGGADGGINAGSDGGTAGGPRLRVTPYQRQDSAMLATVAQADALILRPPHAAPLAAGSLVEVIRLDSGILST